MEYELNQHQIHVLHLYTNEDYRENVLRSFRGEISKTAQQIIEEINNGI